MHLQSQTSSMWNIHRQRLALSEITLQHSSTPHSSQELWNQRQLQSPPSLRTIESDSNEPTFPDAFGTQHPIVPPSLNDLILPPNPFNVLATMTVIQQDQEDSPDHRSRLIRPQSRPPHEFKHYRRVGETTDDNTFYLSENEPRRVY